MRLKTSLLILCSLGLFALGFTYQQTDDEWISLFDGETLDGWKASENPNSFWVDDGRIVVNGDRGHLFYSGPVENHNFTNFEFKAEVMTTENSNSGIYFHTEYQDSGWPSQGYEAQVNNSYEKDPRKTASLYGIDDVMEAPASDGEWFTYYIKVQGNEVTIAINGKTQVNYTEPESVDRTGQVLSSGTFALQAHDPNSKVYFKNIRVKPL